MRFTVGPAGPDDDLAVFGRRFGPEQDLPRRRRTVVATSNGKLVGVSSAVWSHRHPRYGFAEIRVVPECRRAGIGTALVAALEKVAAGPLLFNFETTEPENRGLAPLLQSRGYHRPVAGTTVRIDIETALRQLPDRRETGAGFAITAEALTNEIEELHEAVYAHHHTWAGPYVPTPGQPWITMAGSVVPGTMFVARDEAGPIIATSVLTGRFAEGADGFMVPTGFTDRDRCRQPERVLGLLVARSLSAAADVGLSSLNVECDTTYLELQSLLSTIPAVTVTEREVWTGPPTEPESAGA